MPTAGTLRSAAPAGPGPNMNATAVASKADSVMRNMRRSCCQGDQSAQAATSPPEILLEDNADAVLPRPYHAAVADHAVALGHQLETVRHEYRIRHLDRRAFRGDVHHPAPRAGAVAGNIGRLVDVGTRAASSFFCCDGGGA